MLLSFSGPGKWQPEGKVVVGEVALIQGGEREPHRERERARWGGREGHREGGEHSEHWPFVQQCSV